jgi:hypothetical protein
VVVRDAHQVVSQDQGMVYILKASRPVHLKNTQIVSS